jgi:hemoglobin/transferrin/lactoferrin receptor protein
MTPAPVVVIDTAWLSRAQANTVTDVFRDLPGLDVNGVGVQQPRPIIRGQRGQRILLLQDGLRLNNSRRQQDFGEIPSLVSPAEVERVEVVRGPASVLYGTDAIGGVVNIITKRPTEEGWHGVVGYRHGAEEGQNRGDATLTGRFGKFDLLVDGTLREAGDYRAPAGRFGSIRLENATVVHATGVKDRSIGVRAGFEPAAGQSLWARFEEYHSENAGFGYVDPSAYAPGQPKIDITYPDQRYRRVTLGYSGVDLGSAVADRVDLLAYGQSNERRLVFDLFTGFGPQGPPGAGVRVLNRNWSNLGTVGFRLEAKKLAVPGVLLTYGVDMFRDRSRNTDLDSTTVVGFGPPQLEVNTEPQVPAATYRSVGAFLQGELELGRATVIVGGRAQDLRAEAEPGAGLTSTLASKTVSTAVGSANVLFALSPELTLVGTVGRAFRAPNLIEWFFEGATPEGNGYQVRSPDLRPEHSLNVDVGVRYRRGRFSGEAFVYRNAVSDGIRIAPTGDTLGGLPAYRNVNVEELLFRGIEASARLSLVGGLSAQAGITKTDTQDQLDPSNPIGDSFSSKLTGSLLYRDAGDRFWAEYAVRHNGARKDVNLVRNPLGDVLPSFTVHALRGGITVLRRAGTTQRLGIAVENLTNTLYAEFTNASFFRPEPRRRVTFNWEVAF